MQLPCTLEYNATGAPHQPARFRLVLCSSWTQGTQGSPWRSWVPPACPEPPARGMLKLCPAGTRHGGSSHGLFQLWVTALTSTVRVQDLALHPKRRSPSHLQPAQPAPARAGSSQPLSGMSFKGLLAYSPSLAEPSAAERLLSPPGESAAGSLHRLGPQHPPTHRLPATLPPLAPLPALLGTSSELGGPNICLRLLETSLGR